jgi:hypothetical protein
MDEIQVYREIVRLINENKLDQALKLISKKTMNECMGLIYKNTRLENPYEALNIFYDAFLTFAQKVQSGSFLYQGEKQTEGYFKSACVLKAKEYNRIAGRIPPIVPIDTICADSDYDDEFENERKKFGKEYFEYSGVDLWEGEKEEKFSFGNVLMLFHKLDEKCKFIIILKHIVGLSHEQIAYMIGSFYEIGSRDVSKTELNRCMNKLKTMVYN